VGKVDTGRVTFQWPSWVTVTGRARGRLASSTTCRRVFGGVTVPTKTTSSRKVCPAIGVVTVMVAAGAGGAVVAPVGRATITDFAGKTAVMRPPMPTVGDGAPASSCSTSSVLPAGSLVSISASSADCLAVLRITSTLSLPMVRRKAKGPDEATLSVRTSSPPWRSAACALRMPASFLMRWYTA